MQDMNYTHNPNQHAQSPEKTVWQIRHEVLRAATENVMRAYADSTLEQPTVRIEHAETPQVTDIHLRIADIHAQATDAPVPQSQPNESLANAFIAANQPKTTTERFQDAA